MQMNEEIDLNAVGMRSGGIVVSILSTALLADELYKRKLNRSLPWALFDRCITASLGGLGTLALLGKRLKR
jgi:hypothetical protein